MLETKERLKAEDKVRKEEDAKASAVADADTAMDGRRKAEDQLAKKTLELQGVKTQLKANQASSLAEQKLETESKQKLEALQKEKGILEKALREEEKAKKEAKSGKTEADKKAAKLEESLAKEITAEKQAEKVIHAAEAAKANAEKTLAQAKKDKKTLEDKAKEDMKSLA